VVPTVIRVRLRSFSPVYAAAPSWLGRLAGAGEVAPVVSALSNTGKTVPYISTIEEGSSAA